MMSDLVSNDRLTNKAPNISTAACKINSLTSLSPPPLNQPKIDFEDCAETLPLTQPKNPAQGRVFQ